MDPKTGATNVTYTSVDRPEARSWREWFAENRGGRVGLIGQAFDRSSVRLAAGAGPFDRVEVWPTARNVLAPHVTVVLTTGDVRITGGSVLAQRSLLHDGRRWWERLGVGWDLEVVQATPLRSATMTWAGGSSQYAAGGPRSRVLQVMLPHWLLFLLGFPLPAMAYARWQRTRGRRRRGECLACGYDRRATPAAAPCPECGTLPVSVEPSAAA